MHFSRGCVIENTVRKQWIGGVVASEPCSARGTGEFAPVGRNRFIAPIGRAPSHTFGFRRKRRREAAQ
jgi:hypothetical protein